MDNTKIRYEKTIDLKHLGLAVLRQWKWILVAAVAVAIVLAGLEYLSLAKVDLTPHPVMSETELAEAEATIASNNSTIELYGHYINDNTNHITLYQSEVAAYEAAKAALLQAQGTTPEMTLELLQTMRLIDEKNELIATRQANTEQLKSEIASFEQQNAELQESMKEMTTPTVDKAKPVKQAILGFAIGAVLACGVVFVCYLLDKRLQDAKDISANFGVKVLASVHMPVSQEQLEKHKGVDKLLDRLAGANMAVDVDREYAIAAAKLQVLAGERKQVLVTGTLPQETLDAAAKKLFAAMPGAELKAVVAQDLPNNPEGIVQIPYSVVLLVEEVGKTKADAMIPTLELLQQSKADVAGAFVL